MQDEILFHRGAEGGNLNVTVISFISFKQVKMNKTDVKVFIKAERAAPKLTRHCVCCQLVI